MAASDSRLASLHRLPKQWASSPQYLVQAAQLSQSKRPQSLESVHQPMKKYTTFSRILSEQQTGWKQLPDLLLSQTLLSQLLAFS